MEITFLETDAIQLVNKNQAGCVLDLLLRVVIQFVVMELEHLMKCVIMLLQMQDVMLDACQSTINGLVQGLLDLLQHVILNAEMVSY